MKKFTIYLTNNTTGAASPIDNIIAPDNYTASDYIKDCEKNADTEYVEMIKAGTIEIVEV